MHPRQLNRARRVLLCKKRPRRRTRCRDGHGRPKHAQPPPKRRKATSCTKITSTTARAATSASSTRPMDRTRILEAVRSSQVPSAAKAGAEPLRRGSPLRRLFSHSLTGSLPLSNRKKTAWSRCGVGIGGTYRMRYRCRYSYRFTGVGGLHGRRLHRRDARCASLEWDRNIPFALESAQRRLN